MSDARFFLRLRSRVLLISVFALIGSAIGSYIARPPVYDAQWSSVVVASGATDLSSRLAGANLAKARISTFASLATSARILDETDRVLEARNSGRSGPVRYTMRVEVPQDSVEMRLHVTDPSAEAAQRRIEAWAEVLTAEISRVEAAQGTIGTGTQLGVELLGTPTVSAPPSSWVRLMWPLAGAILGGLCGFALYNLLYRLRAPIVASSDLEAKLGAPVIAVLDGEYGASSAKGEENAGVLLAGRFDLTGRFSDKDGTVLVADLRDGQLAGKMCDVLTKEQMKIGDIPPQRRFVSTGTLFQAVQLLPRHPLILCVDVGADNMHWIARAADLLATQNTNLHGLVLSNIPKSGIADALFRIRRPT